MDPSATGIACAKKLVPSGRFIQQSLDEQLDWLEEAEFDIVVSTEVIEHLFDPNRLLTNARKALRSGGYLIITTPYHGYLKNLAIAGLGKWDSHHQSLRVGGHIKFWSRVTMSEMLLHNGFEVVEFRGVGRVKWLWKSMMMIGRKNGSTSD